MKLPATVYLPTGTTLTPAEVRKAVGGISRAGLQYWRDHHQFPNFYGQNSQAVYDTKELVGWITGHQVIVRWV